MVLFTLNKYFEKIHKTVNISKTVRDIKKTNRKISPDSTPCRFWTFPIKCIYLYKCRTLNTRATKFDDDVIKCLHVNNSKTVIVIKTRPTYYDFVDILLIVSNDKIQLLLTLKILVITYFEKYTKSLISRKR